MEADLTEYQLLKSGKLSLTKNSSLAELPKVLIQARIAQGLSQTDLAERMKLKPQQIQRYEATNYMGASLARLIELAEVLGVKISEAYESDKPAASGAIFSWAGATEVMWSRFPAKEMVRRGWLNIGAHQSTVEAVREYFLSRAGPQFASALHKKKVRAGSVPNEFALLAWQARVLSCAKEAYDACLLKPFELNDSWLAELAQLTARKDGPSLVRGLLAQKGIALVIEPHLSGTHLDGAAMMAEAGYPVVALTLRHDRLDNFWFALFHEIAHVYLHLFNSTRFDFFDEEDGVELDPIEKEADDFAVSRLIPDDKWQFCLSRFSLSAESVRLDAKNLGIGASIVAGRIRKERNNYMILNELVGQKAVRSQFEEIDHGK
jgi:HTH-type transcriptional regulator/antitoxin HigA